MVHNGEIYNTKNFVLVFWKDILLERNQTQKFVHLYEEFGFCDKLDGDFALS
jgi:asparagine synthetase B (glutamine-hydrolysing)